MFICKTQMPTAASFWVCVRIKHDVCEALNGARHIVKMKPVAATVRHHHHFILGTERTWTIWICLGDSMYFQRYRKRTLSTSLNYHHHYLLAHTHTSRTGFPEFCVHRVSHGCWLAVSSKITQERNTRKGSYFPSMSNGIPCTWRET